jgi:glycosyltransferase involved in cell wall biosynthesis
MKKLFFKAVQNADLVITAGNSLFDLLKPLAKSIINIENGYDPELFHPIPIEEARQKLDIPASEIVIGYFGSLEPGFGIEDLIEASRLLGKHVSKVLLLMAGKDNLKLDYASYNIDYRGFLPQKEIPVLINSCDVVVIPYLPSKMKQWCNACKIAEYVACHKPVVATNIADHNTIFASTPQSICESGNPESMAAAIQLQLKAPQLLNNTEHLTWQQLGKKLAHSLEALRISN